MEFVGPRGQLDPQGVPPTPAVPMMAPNDVPPEVDPAQAMGGARMLLDRFFAAMQNRSPQSIMKAQALANQRFQQLLQDKSQSAARRGAFQQYINARDQKANLGQNNGLAS